MAVDRSGGKPENLAGADVDPVAAAAAAGDTAALDLINDANPQAAASAPITVRARLAIFSTLYELCEDVSVFKPWLALLWLVHLLQLLFISTGPQMNMPWASMPIMYDGIYLFLHSLSFIPHQAVPRAGGGSDSTVAFPPLNLFIFAIIFTVVILALVLWSALGNAGFTSYLPTWRLKLLRILSRIALHALSLPLFTSLLGVFSCNSGEMWLQSNIECFTSGHIVLCALACVFAPLLAMYLAGYALLVVDRNFDVTSKTSLLSAGHGRIAALDLVMNVVLAVCWIALGANSNVSGWVYIIFVLAAQLVPGLLTIHFLPYHRIGLNAARAAMSFMAAGSAIAGIAALAINKQGNDAGGVLFIVLLPLMAYMGYTATWMRWHMFSKDTLLPSPLLVEVKTRYLLISALEHEHRRGTLAGYLPVQVHDPDAGGSSSGGGSAAAAGVVQNDESRIATPSGVRTEANDGTSMASGSAVSSAATKPQTRMLPGLMQEVSSKGVIYTIVRALGVGAQGAARKVLHQYDPDVLMKVVTLFRQYEEIFPASAQLQCAIAVFQGFARANRYLERVHLQAAQARADPSALDVQFLCWARLHRLDSTDDESTDSKMTVAKRVEFELIQQQNQKLTLRAHVLVSDLWTVLQDKNPNLDRLSSLGLQINRLTSTIQGNHDKLLSMAPQSISVMREAARFFIEVANDPRRGRELLLDAEQIEDEQSRLRSAVTETDILLGASVTDFDISGDGVAILRVSSKVESLGIIMYGNAAALKLLGFHSRELIGHDINTLVPEPIASVHRNFLVKYTEDGEETIVNTSRVYFMQHRAGYVLPASVWVRPAADEWAAVCEEINTPLSFIFFAGVEMGWRVTGVCKKAMAALNVDTQVMRSGSLSASSIIPQLQLSLRRLQDENGALIELQPLVDYADLAHAGQHSARSSDVNHMPSSTPLLLVHARQQVLRMPTLNTLVHIIRFRSASASEARRFRRDQELALAAAAADGRPSGSGSGGSGAEPPLFSFDSVLPAHATGGGDISLCPIMRKSAAARGANGVAPPNTVAAAAAAKAVAPNGSTPHGLLASESFERPDSGGREPSPPAPATRTPITSPSHSMHRSGGGEHPLQVSAAPLRTIESSPNPASRRPSLSVSSGGALRPALSRSTHQSSVGDDTPALPGTPNFGLTSPLQPSMSREPSRRFSMETPGGSRRVMWEQPATVTDAAVSVTDAGAGNAVKALAPEQPMVVNAEDSDNEEANSSSLAGASGSSSDGGHGAPRPVLSPVHRPANSRELDTSTSLLAQPLDAKPAGVGAAGMSGAFDASINQPPRLGGMRPSMSVGGAGGGAAGVRASRAGSVDDDQQGGRPGSVHSKGSASSKSSVNDVLRRSVQVRSTRMERSLRLLHQAVLLLVIAVAVMNLTAVFVTSSLLRQLITNMALVSESGQRVQHLQDAMIDVSDQVLSQAGVYTPRAAWAAVLPHTRTAVAEFERLHQELYMQLDVAQADEVELYSRDNLRLEDLVPGTYVSRSNYSATYRNVSFANGGLEFIAKARLFMGLPEAAMLMTNPVVFWLNSNPNAVLLDAATRAVILSDGRSAHQAADIRTADLIVIILSLSLLSSIALFIMAPAVCNVQRTKRNVFQVFLHVPSSVIRALRLMSTKRALQLKREQDGFDEDEDTQDNAVYGTDAEFMGQQTPNLNRGESGAAAGSETDRCGARPSYNMMRSSSVNVNPLAEDDTGERELKAALNALANRRASVDVPAATSGVEGKYMLHRVTGTPATTTPRRGLCGCCRKSPSTVPEMPLGFGRGKRHFQSRSSSGTSTFLVLAWPVLLCFAYYIGVYFWRHQIVEYSKTARAETLFMTAVGTRVAHAAYTTKQAWAYCDPSWVTQKVAETRATVAFVDTTLNKLLYGDASMNFNSLLQSMPAIHDLFLSNACVPSATTVGYSMTECTTTFMDGILARGGLRGATTEYFQLVEQALRDREALLAAGVCNTTILATDPSLRLMDKLGSVYLAPAYGVASSTVHRVGSDAISVFVTNDIALAFICIVAMFVVYLAMYRPRIYKMDRDIKDCRGLLLLFPDDVVRSIPAVAQAGRDMVAAVSGTEAH